jgi:hypothetical protein
MNYWHWFRTRTPTTQIRKTPIDAEDLHGCSFIKESLACVRTLAFPFDSQSTGRDRPLSALNGSCDGNRLRPVLWLSNSSFATLHISHL